MNTRKQVLIMSALLMVMLVVLAVYAAWYPSRAEDAESHFEEARAERGSILFARNCRLCHGDLAEGGSLGGRLPAAPALDRPDLQGFEDTDATLAAEVGPADETIEVSDGEAVSEGDVILIDEERMLVESVDETTVGVQRGYGHTEAAGHFPDTTIWGFDQAVLDEQIDLMTNSIACGRVGTAMPPWSQEQGGPLSDEQIQQLVVLISTARWDLVEHEIDIEDAIDSQLTAPVPAETETITEDDTEIMVTEIMVSDVTRFQDEQAIRIGNERLRVKEIPDFDPTETNIPGTLVVQRGIHGTFAEPHPVETGIFNFPEVADPSVNEAACGQTAQPPAPQGTPELIEDFEGQTVEISAFGVMFNTDLLEVDSDGQARVRFENQEAVPHNVAVYNSESDTTPVSEGSVGITFEGPDVVDDTVFDIPEPGEYFFRCDVHPTLMTGTFVVN